jgi:hypothetical protein
VTQPEFMPMKLTNCNMRQKLIGGIALVLAVAATAVLGQNYTADWSTIDGGGGTSTGGAYSVSGTTGQADAGRMSGGNYSLDGGFWGIIGAVQMLGAPLLSVSLTASNTVVVAWPYPSTGFGLQQVGAVATTNWASVTTPPTQVCSQWQLIVQPVSGNRFYRLMQ